MIVWGVVVVLFCIVALVVKLELKGMLAWPGWPMLLA